MLYNTPTRNFRLHKQTQASSELTSISWSNGQSFDLVGYKSLALNPN